MKLIEAEASSPNFINELQSGILKYPEFNFYAATNAREYANEFVGEDSKDVNFSSLRLAIALGRYNYLVVVSRNPQNVQLAARLEHRFNNLVAAESTARKQAGLLPTIGWEVEIPRYPYQANGTYYTKYKNFSNAIGLPINSYADVSGWEFAPSPSYSSEVAGFMLNQLIKGGFIASLSDSQDPEEIMKRLDVKLVSLHINLGLPLRNGGDEALYDYHLFNAALAIAYTSALRLKNKTFTLHAFQKDVTSMPGGFGGGGRFEIKDLEVRDSSVYRLMHEAQLVGAALIGSVELGDARSR